MKRTVEVVEIPVNEDTNDFLRMFYASMELANNKEVSNENVA